MDAREEELERLIAQFIEEREAGSPASAEDFAAAHPEFEEQLLTSLRGLAGLEGLLPRDPGGPEGGRLGRFKILGELGRGGMGRVLLAEAPDGTRAALKVLAPLRSLDQRAVERFRREALALERLRHPGIVGVLEAHLDSERPFIAMQYVEGESLDKLLAAERAGGECRLPGTGPREVRAARLLAGLCAAVDSLHGSGLLHRDIKPANVIVDREGRPVLVDLGLVGGDLGSTLTQSGDLLGTPHFMSPEQARGVEVDARSDVWALGALLFQALTLEPPYTEGDATTVLARVRSTPPRRVRRVRSDVPARLAGVVRRALAVHPRLRTPSAGALGRELEDVLSGRRPRVGALQRLAGPAELLSFHRGALALAALLLIALALVPVALSRRAQQRRAELDGLERTALIAWVDGEEARSLEHVSQVLARDPERASAQLLEAMASDRPPGPELSGQTAQAWAMLREREPTEALSILDRVIAERPEDLVPIALAARAARWLGQQERTARENTVLVRLLPEARKPRLRLAFALYNMERFDESLAVISEATQTWPEDPSLLEFHARTLLRLGRGEEAYELAERAFRHSGARPTPRVLNTYSVSLSVRKEHDQAQDVLRDLLERDPSRSQAWYNLAYSLDGEHRAREAVNAYVSAAEEGDARSMAALAWLHSGALRGECDECDAVYEADPALLDLDLAESFALEAIESDGGRHLEILSLSAKVAERVGRPEGARELLRELEEASDDDRRIANCRRALRLLPRD